MILVVVTLSVCTHSVLTKFYEIGKSPHTQGK